MRLFEIDDIDKTWTKSKGINLNFANDQSTTRLKTKAKQYLSEIQKLKGQL